MTPRPPVLPPRADGASRLLSFVGGRADLPRRGYSLFVRLMKWSLPLVALVIVGVLIVRLQESELPPPKLSGTPSVTPEGQVALIGARYEGVDAAGRAFHVTADRAQHPLTDIGAVMLEKPMADMALDDGGGIAASAARGSYDRAASLLKLSGGVRFFHDSGYEITMDEIDIRMTQRQAQSLSPVRAQGPAGTIMAAGLEVMASGDRIVFKGPARLVLSPAALKGGKI